MKLGRILCAHGFVFQKDTFVRKVNSFTNVQIDLNGFVCFKQYHVQSDRYNTVYLDVQIKDLSKVYALFQIIRIIGVNNEVREEKEEDNDGFIDYVKKARIDFVQAVNAQKWNAELRTKAENFLICFDQMTGLILSNEKELK